MVAIAKNKNIGENFMKNNKKINKKHSKNRNDSALKSSHFDPFGSYTGASVDGEKPVQDQDDL